MASPQLHGDALATVRHRGSHLQIIASAGSGKTEVVSRRVADLPAGVIETTLRRRCDRPCCAGILTQTQK